MRFYHTTQYVCLLFASFSIFNCSVACAWVCVFVSNGLNIFYQKKNSYRSMLFAIFCCHFVLTAWKGTGKLGWQEGEKGDIYFNNIWINHKLFVHSRSNRTLEIFTFQQIPKIPVINTLLVTINIIDNLLSHNAIHTHTLIEQMV